MPRTRHIRRTTVLRPLALAVLALAAGCAGEGDPSGGSGGNGSATDFATLQREIFDRSCAIASCHNTATQQGGLDLSANVSYDDLVGVEPQNPVANGAGLLRVVPDEPGASFLLQKLTGDLAPGEGAPMPLGAAPLPADEIEMVRSWILAGAPRD